MRAKHALSGAAWTALALALGSTLACASAPEPPRDPYAAPVLPLREGATVTGEVYPGHPHVFPLPLEEGTYFEIHLDRSRGEVSVLVFGPGVAVDSAPEAAYSFGEAAPDSPQVVWEMARESGAYHLRLASQNGESINYNLELRALRPATERDRSRHRALEVYEEAGHLRDAGRTEEALETFLGARELFRQGEHERGIAATYTARGKIFRALKRWDEARAEYVEARKHWHLGGDSLSVAGTLLDLADLDRAMTHWNDAEAHIEEALGIARGVDAVYVEANGQDQLCILFLESGRYMKGVDACRDAIAANRALDQRHHQLVDDLINLGALFRFQGNFERARTYLLEADEILTEHPDLRQKATVRNDLAILLDFEGEYLDALAEYQKALDSYEKLGDTSFVGTVLANMGTIYQRLDDEDAALDYYRQSLARMEEAGEPIRRLQTLHDLGWLYIHRGEMDAARSTLEEARSLAEDLESAPLLAASYERIGEFQLADGQPSAAEKSLDTARSLYRSVGSRWREPSVLVQLARAHQALGQSDEALALLQEAIELYEELGRPAGRADAFYTRAKFERAAGDLELARLDVEQALAEAETLRPQVGGDEFRTLLSQTTRPYFDLYIDILMEQHRRSPEGGHAAEALRASERARARSLLEILPEAGLGLRGEVPEELISARIALQHRVNAKELARQDLLRTASPDAGELFGIKLDLEGLLTDLQEVERRIRLVSPRYAALTRPEPVTVGEIQRSLLDPETSMLEFSLGEERSFLWLLTDKEFRSYDLPERAKIEDAARCVHWLITAYGDPPDTTDLAQPELQCLGDSADRYPGQDEGTNPFERRSGRRETIRTTYLRRAGDLSRLLLGAAAKDGLLRFRLAIVSDGALEYVPLGALPSPEGGAAPLVTDHELVRLPSASVLAFQRTHPKPAHRPDRQVTIVADPVYSAADKRVANLAGHDAETRGAAPGDDVATTSPLDRLDFSAREAEAIAALAPPGQSLVLTDLDANRDAVVGGALSGARYVHFATHGLIDTRYPQLSSLVLSLVDRNGNPDPSGYFRLHDIYGLALDDTDMVVLSACDTALGREVRGEGLIGLTRGFLYAGAQRVVASLWQVQDRVTADLMERFYRGLLQEGRSPADALRHAQLETRRSAAGAYSFPYYWAGFVLQGEWR